MINRNDFQTKQNYLLTSTSEVTLKEIMQVGKAAEKQAGGHIDIQSFGKLFGLNLPESNIHVAMPVKISYSAGNAPVLIVAFDSENCKEIKDLALALEDALSVKSFVYEDLNDFAKAVDYYHNNFKEKTTPRPVVDYEGHVLRTDELRFEEKFAELKDKLNPDVVEFIENELKENGSALFEDEIIRNFANIMNLHQAKAADYNYAIMDSMEMHMQAGKQFGNVPQGFYECDEVYTDVIANLYEKFKEQEDMEYEC